MVLRHGPPTSLANLEAEVPQAYFHMDSQGPVGSPIYSASDDLRNEGQIYSACWITSSRPNPGRDFSTGRGTSTEAEITGTRC